jgi:hypothetical protein
MTREELVKQKAQEFTSRGEFSPTLTECFIAGAEWEHKRLVEKACEWLKENLSEGYDIDNYPMVRCYDIDMEDFIKEFSREMEE